jgi:hypothetical protein
MLLDELAARAIPYLRVGRSRPTTFSSSAAMK